MLEPGNNDDLPPIPGKRYFTIGEVSELCAVKPHVLALLGARVPAAEARQAARQPPLLSAPRRPDHPPDPQPALRRGLYDRRRAAAAHGRRSPYRHEPEPADHSPDPRRARGRPQAAAPVAAARARVSGPTVLSLNCAISVGAWRSLVAHLHGVQGVAGSNPVAPTNLDFLALVPSSHDSAVSWEAAYRSITTEYSAPLFLEQYKLETNPFAADAARPVFASHSMRYALLKLEDLFQKHLQSPVLERPPRRWQDDADAAAFAPAQGPHRSPGSNRPARRASNCCCSCSRRSGPAPSTARAPELRRILEVYLRHQAGNGRFAFVVADGLERFAAPVLRELEALAQMRLRNRPIVHSWR